MKQKTLRIQQLKKYYQTSKDDLQIKLDEVNSCLNSYQYLQQDQINALKNFTIYLRKSLEENKMPNKKLFAKIRQLLISSQDRLNKTDNILYVKTFEASNEQKSSFEEIYKYIEILLENAICAVSINKLEYLIPVAYQKANFLSKRISLVELLEKYSYKTLTKNEQLKMQNIIQRTKNKLENVLATDIKAFKLLKNDKKVSTEQLEIYLKKFEDYLENNISEKDIYLIRKTLNDFISDTTYEVDDKKAFAIFLKEVKNIITNSSSEYEKSDDFIISKIKKGEIPLRIDYPASCFTMLNTNFEKLDEVKGERIISIDSINALDIDTAFSIKDFGDIYVLNVYVVDVPTFLKNNPKICREAYKRATSFYVHLDNEDINIDMLPEVLLADYLTLCQKHPRNVVMFTFVIGENGQIYSSSVDRKRVIVTDNLDRLTTDKILKSKSYNDRYLKEDLITYQKLCEKIKNVSDNEYINRLNLFDANGLAALSSILVNSYVGKSADFAIYRENGKYVKNYENFAYAHSSTPLRKFVSNINLAFFLEQNDLISFPQKDLSYVEDNIDEIINHLNRQERLSKLVDSNASFVKKYII